MKISDSLEVEFPIQQVWDLLEDPRRSMGAMPGVQSVEIRDETTFDLTVAQRVGPFRVQFQVTMMLSEVAPPNRLVATGQGKESLGRCCGYPRPTWSGKTSVRTGPGSPTRSRSRYWANWVTSVHR